MRILFLTQIIPYPPDAGPKVKTWHVLRYLVELGHQVTLVSFMRKEEEEHIDELRKLCHAVFIVPLRRSRLADIFYFLTSLVRGKPFLVERDDRFSMQELVNRLVVSESIDVIHADQLTMAQFAWRAGESVSRISRTLDREIDDLHNHPFGRANHHPAMIFDAHNAVWTILERMSKNTRWFLKPVIALEARKVKYYEGWVIRNFDHTLAVTEIDRQALQAAAAFAFPKSTSNELPVSVIPIAVDTHHLKPTRRQPGCWNILTIGTLHYPPNADGIRWFLREIYPFICQQIPEVSMTVVGKNPPRNLLRLASQSNQRITFTGYVADLNPLFEQSTLMVVPVRAGGGMRVRILEGFARAMPIVTTTVGLEGIAARHDQDVVVRDEPEEFAQVVVKLLEDESWQAQLAHNGRCLAEKLYDWEFVLKDLDVIYTQIGERAQALRR
jgi:polysaccharide biosynthesis protein PslH